MALSTAARRLRRDLEQLERQVNPQLLVRPSSNSLLEWHFVAHHLPDDSVYSGGVYHGKLLFPEEYPRAPPSLFMLTPNGRFETNRRLCLSMTDFHPESWSPAWSIESILVGLISFMLDVDKDVRAVGSIHESPETRMRLAKSSLAFNLANAEFQDLFPEFAEACTRGEGVPACPVGGELHVATGTPGQVNCTINDESHGGETTSKSVKMPDATSAPLDLLCITSTMGADATAASGSSTDSAGKPSGAAPTLQDPPEEPQPMPDGGVAELAAVSPPDSVPLDVAEALVTPAECWICRDAESGEPLIQPCACRGSMSGVHASCVEEWIRRYRASALEDDVPHCSVCNQPYRGTERRPGPLAFASHLCGDLVRQAVRSVLLFALLYAYWAASQPDLVSLPWRAALFTGSGSFYAFKALVLTVSVPAGRPPPAGCWIRFFQRDFRVLAVDMAEALATVIIAGLGCAYGRLPYYTFLPLCLLIVMPTGAFLVGRDGAPTWSRALMVVVVICGTPLLIAKHVVLSVWRNPKRLVDPTDGLAHTSVPLAALPLCCLASNAPVLVLWASHCVVLLVGLAEVGAVKRLRWKQGRIWWIFLQLSMLSAYVGNLLNGFSEGFSKNQMAFVVLGVSMPWLGLCCSLALIVNWELLMRQYHSWQHRNGSFTLGGGGTTSLGPETIGLPRLGVPAAGVAPRGGAAVQDV